MARTPFRRALPGLVAIGLGAVLLPAGSRAAEPVPAATATALAACHSETSDLKRLECYDAASSSLAAGSISPPSAGPTTGSDNLPTKLDLAMPDDQKGWIVRRAQSPLDRSLQVAAALPSTQAKIERLAASGRTAQKAALIVTCRNHQTDVFVAYLDIVDGMGPIPVEYRIDDNAPVSEKWGISQDFQSYGVWHTAQTVPLIKKLASAHHFFVRANPGPMGVSEAEFDLAGIDEAIKPVGEACHW